MVKVSINGKGSRIAIDQVLQAKQILDTLIAKQRVHLYKPIQIAEILYRVRKQALTFEQIQHQLESYRNPSKRWRDSVTRLLLDRVSTSSQKYQDNLFEKNAIPPHTLLILAQANKNGVIEIYLSAISRKAATHLKNRKISGIRHSTNV